MRIIRPIVVFLILTGSLFAQLSTNLEILSQYDDNLFRSPYPVRDVLTNIDLRLSYRPENSNVNLYYNGDVFLYRENTLRNFYLHSIGLNYYRPFGENKTNTFYFGAEWALRKNGDTYNYFDYNQAYIYSNFRLDLNLFFLRGGYNFRYRNYLQIPDLTNYRQYIFLQTNRSFATKTTLIMEADLGNKVFSGRELFTSTGTTGHGGRGYGGGRFNPYTDVTATSVSEVPALSHFVFLTRVTQSLFSKMGVYVQYRQQISLTKETDFVNADGFYQDEEIFDDPFSYESKGWSSQLTWMISRSVKIQIRGAVTSKNYISEQAYVSAEDTLASGGSRSDNMQTFNVNFTKTFYVNKKGLKNFQFYMNYYYIENSSNSFWYDYKNSVIGAGIKWQL